VRSLRSGRGLVRLVVLAVLITGAWTWLEDSSQVTIRAHFTSAEGLNVDDDVKVLGVSVGRVTQIENDGDGVVVTLEVDEDQPIPADARAAIVSPSLVSGRFVQLAPVWSGGDRLEDGATIDEARTAVPVTFDDVKQQLTDLASTLGPAGSKNGGRKGGALATTIRALEQSLRNGNSGRLRTAIVELHGAASALSDGRSDLFSTIENLDTFTLNLALHDGAVRGFTEELDAVSTVLANNRRAIRGAVRDLGVVLGLTERYLKKHRGPIVETTRDLNLLMAAIADRSNELAGVFHLAPHALIGLFNTIEDQAIVVRASGTGYDTAAQLICGALLGTGGTSRQCRGALDPLFDLLGLTPGDLR
jgi:phospholipid/cholesterol/gamma-HCH transport system substrate-binding protein